MLFNSGAFGVFLIIALLLFWFSERRVRLFVLVGLSYYFYMYNNPVYFFLLAALTIVNFLLAIEIARRPRFARHFLILAVSIDLLSIGFFKYANFFLWQVDFVRILLGAEKTFPLLKIMLPLGISFFTFQMISYVVDTYRGEPAEKSFWNFAAYVSFFPQLVAGPIVRPNVLLPQIKAKHVYNREQAVHGMFLIAQGLIKKIVFADFLGGHVDKMFLDLGGYSALATLVVVYAYAFQIYFDFSGYTDIAIGCGKLFGFEIPINFNLPYTAKSPREFWQRWHISLSTWLRDYLYIPLGGNRQTKERTYLNIMITMLLGGLWHGANWTFVVWGGYHGILLVLERFLKDQFALARRIFSRDSAILSFLSALFTFHLVSLGWILFRSDSLTKAARIFRNILSFDMDFPLEQIPAVLLLIVAAVSHVLRRKWDMEEWFVGLPAPVQAFGYSCAVILTYLFFTEEHRFIYFQF